MPQYQTQYGAKIWYIPGADRDDLKPFPEWPSLWQYSLKNENDIQRFLIDLVKYEIRDVFHRLEDCAFFVTTRPACKGQIYTFKKLYREYLKVGEGYQLRSSPYIDQGRKYWIDCTDTSPYDIISRTAKILRTI